MRTTLTLDEDVAAMLEQVRAKQGVSLREAVNEALRLGLEQAVRPPRKSGKRYRTRAVSAGRCRLENLDDVSGVLAWLEGESFR